jgi:hypothetical protein
MGVTTRRQLLTVAVATVAGVIAAPGVAGATVVRDRTRRRFGPVALVSDSQSAGYLPGLKAQLRRLRVGPYRLDIRPGRRTTQANGRIASGLDAVQRMRLARFDPKVWLVSLGGNDFDPFIHGAVVFEDEITSLLDAIGPTKRVTWFTVWHYNAPDVSMRFNDALRSVAAARSNVVVSDWATVAALHPEFDIGDGVHLNRRGSVFHNEFLVKAAVSACQGAATSS